MDSLFWKKSRYRASIIIGTVLSLFWLLIAMKAHWQLATISFSILVLLTIVNLVRSFIDKVNITETGITVTRYFQTRQIHWEDISTMDPKLSGFLLTSFDGDVRVFVSKEATDLWKLINDVEKQRPDLLQSTRTDFHENPIIAGLIALAGLFIMYYSGQQIILHPVNLLPKLIFFFFGLAFVLLAIFSIRRFRFDQDRLIVKSLLRERNIHPGRIDFLKCTNTSLHIISRDGYSVSIENLMEGLPSFLLTFRSWRQLLQKDLHEIMESGDEPETLTGIIKYE